MATEFQMPKLGLTMEAGTILEWLVPSNTEVSPGTAVLLIETDKVESEVEVAEGGILHHVGEVGETYDCGVLIGWFLAEGEEAPAGRAASRGSSSVVPVSAQESGRDLPQRRSEATTIAASDGRVLASPNAKRVAAELGVDLSFVAGTGPGGRIVSEDVVEASKRPQPVAPASVAAAVPVGPMSGGGARALATFGARNFADLLGVDLDQVASLTGDPRLTKDDVVAHVRNALAGPEPAAEPAPPSSPLLQTPTGVTPLRGMRGTIASRMHASLQDMAQLTLMMDVDMTAVVEDREKRKSAARAGGPQGRSEPGSDNGVEGNTPGFTDYVIAAAAKALGDHPYVNSQITDDGVAQLPEVHVGMAVALDDGLMVPVIKDTSTLDLDSLAAETSRLASATRAGKLQLSEIEGGTFSVTALGMFGVDGFTPVINPPNTAILGVGRLRDEVAWEGDTPVKQTVLTLSLTWDHRAFDGAPAAEFTATVKGYLEAGDVA